MENMNTPRVVPRAKFAMALATTAVLAPVSVGQAVEEGPAITIYSSADPASFDPQQYIAQQRMGYNPMSVWQVPGFGVVKELRTIDLEVGVNELRFTDVAAFIDPTTVSFTDLTDEDGTTVLEQNFRFDLVSPDKIFEKYIDRDVTLISTDQGTDFTVSGKLLSVSGEVFILQTDAGLEFVNRSRAWLKLPSLPLGDLVTRPTLVWLVDSAQAGRHVARTTYQTGGITWRADYNLILNDAETAADLGAWVSLMNLSGAAYKNARLKLIAGDVQRVQSQMPYERRRGGGIGGGALAAAAFQEKAFFEYHLYTLPRRTDILTNTTQQITLFPTARGAAVEKILVYTGLPGASAWNFGNAPMQDRGIGGQSDPKVDVYISFMNEESNKLGMPLPAGKVRVYKSDQADGTLEFIGEDLIDHTPRDEKVLIKVGQSFDVVGERTQTDFRIDTRAHVMEETFRIQIRNHKDEDQRVIIRESLFRWRNWEITVNNVDFEKVDARTIHFPVVVPADGQQTVTYTVKYTW